MTGITNLELYAFDEWFRAFYRSRSGRDYEIAFVRNYDCNSKSETRELVNVEADISVEHNDATWKNLQAQINGLELPARYRYEE